MVQRWQAKKQRGIEFNFTYEEWVAWWIKHLGPNWFEKRGNCAGQYVMARKGDEGPYSVENVRCITCEQNSKEALGNVRGNAKLTREQVIVIYLELKNGPRGTAMRLAQEYKVGDITIRSIQKKLTWGHVTDQLD